MKKTLLSLSSLALVATLSACGGTEAPANEVVVNDMNAMMANPNNPFAQLIYDVTDLFLWPFAGLTMTPAANGIVLEVSSIIALFFYALVSVLIQRLIWITFSRPRV